MLYESWEWPFKALESNGKILTSHLFFPFVKPIIFLKLLFRLAIKLKRSLIFLILASRRVLMKHDVFTINCVSSHLAA